LHPRQDFYTTANLKSPVLAPDLGGT